MIGGDAVAPMDDESGESAANAGGVVSTRLSGAATMRGRSMVRGRMTTVRLSPGPVGEGIRFRRVDRRGRGGEAAANWRSRIDVPYCTALAAPSGAKFYMVEHCLAALSAAGVADALVEVDGPELPHGDGSALAYCDAILEAGLAPAPPVRSIQIIRPLAFNFGRTRYRFDPAPRLACDVTVSLNHFGLLQWQGPIEWEDFRRSIAPARSISRLLPLATAARLALVWALKRGQLGVVVLHKDRVMNFGGLRMPDEMVRHRVIDVLGDMTLAGAPIIGRISAFASSHARNLAAVERLMSSPDVWRMTASGVAS